jgi:hypothetical protein
VELWQQTDGDLPGIEPALKRKCGRARKREANKQRVNPKSPIRPRPLNPMAIGTQNKSVKGGNQHIAYEIINIW